MKMLPSINVTGRRYFVREGYTNLTGTNVTSANINKIPEPNSIGKSSKKI